MSAASQPASRLHGAPGSSSLGGHTPPASCPQPAEARAACARGVRVGPPQPARRPLAAWPHAGSLPWRGMGREEIPRVGDRLSLFERSCGWRQTAVAAAGHSPLRRQEGGRLPRRPRHLLPTVPPLGGCGPARQNRQARAAGTVRPARHRGRPGISCEPGRSPRHRRQTGCERLGKRAGRGARGRPVRSPALKETRRAALPVDPLRVPRCSGPASRQGLAAWPAAPRVVPASPREGRPQVSADLRCLR